MNKMIKVTLGLNLLLCINTINAGDMGPIALNEAKITPFISGEGSFTGNDTLYAGNQPVASFRSPTMSTGSLAVDRYVKFWGARVAAGFVYPYVNGLNFDMETGWNYFGSASGGNHQYSLDGSLSGADLLVGALYKYNNFELFAKGGTLFQRITYNLYVPNLIIHSASGTINSKISWSGSKIDVLPEVKVGVLYDVTTNWGVSLAYMHAFGDDPHLLASFSRFQNDIAQANVDAALRGASLNSLLLGVRYNFA